MTWARCQGRSGFAAQERSFTPSDPLDHIQPLRGVGRTRYRSSPPCPPLTTSERDRAFPIHSTSSNAASDTHTRQTHARAEHSSSNDGRGNLTRGRNIW